MSRQTGEEQALCVGERVFLRRPRGSDCDAFLAFVQASRALHAELVAPPDTEAAFTAWLERTARDDHEAMLDCRRADGAIVGVFNLSNIVRGNFQSAYLGYYAHAAFAGRGYMSEGLRLVLDHAFGPLALHRVEANIQPDNETSVRLVQAVGFRLEGHSPRYLKIHGQWRDHDRYAITAEEWVAARRERAAEPR